MTAPTLRSDIKEQSWMQLPALKHLLATLALEGEARIVGGAVRNACLKQAVGEIDLAVNLPPERVMTLLSKAGFKVIPTGLQHGTITAVADHRGYEITTLRRDVETDGRHAKVTFTDDWQADAARRDFTINALYLDRDGILYDYFDGQKDLAEGYVRFIGRAEDRLREDVLRILRFFRFYAWIGKGEPDQEALEACRAQASRLETLSRERVSREVLKLLQAPHPLRAWHLMQQTHVLDQFLPEAHNIVRLEKLLTLEKNYEIEAEPLVRLAALLPADRHTSEQVAQRLKLSNHEALTLEILAYLPTQFRGKLDPVPFRRELYEHGKEDAVAAALLLTAEEGSDDDLEPILALAAQWQEPSFPIKGEDLLAMGLKSGPALGALLKQVENWWVERDFLPSRDECLAAARELSTTVDKKRAL